MGVFKWGSISVAKTSHKQRQFPLDEQKNLLKIFSELSGPMNTVGTKKKEKN